MVEIKIEKTRIEARSRKLRGIWTLAVQEDLERIFKNKMPCPNCGVNPAEDCGYSTYDPWTGEHDCEAPDNEGEMCDDCHHAHCSLCRLKESYNFKKEEFDVK